MYSKACMRIICSAGVESSADHSYNDRIIDNIIIINNNNSETVFSFLIGGRGYGPISVSRNIENENPATFFFYLHTTTGCLASHIRPRAKPDHQHEDLHSEVKAPLKD